MKKNLKSLSVGAIIFLAVGCFYFFIWPALNSTKATDPKVAPEKINTQQLTEEITLEAVVALIIEKTPFLQINADNPYPENLTSPGPTRLIYYTTTPSYRSAQYRMRLDRESKSSSLHDPIKLNSPRLAGTPKLQQALRVVL